MKKRNNFKLIRIYITCETNSCVEIMFLSQIGKNKRLLYKIRNLVIVTLIVVKPYLSLHIFRAGE